MKTKLYLYGSVVSALLAGLCAALAGHYASSAYALWLNERSLDNSIAGSAARANHIWATTMLVFIVLAGVLLFTGLRSRRRGAAPHEVR